MTQVRLYVDEDAAQHAVVEGLRARGIDVVTVQEVDTASATDAEQLTFAAREGRCIYTLNVAHFCNLHQQFLAEGRSHPGIIVIPRQRYSVGEKIKRLTDFLESVTSEAMRDRLEFL